MDEGIHPATRLRPDLLTQAVIARDAVTVLQLIVQNVPGSSLSFLATSIMSLMSFFVVFPLRSAR
jgi:hypothetical protein